MSEQNDLIYRQDAIDALEEYADRLQMVNWKENPGVPYKAYALNWCINTIRELPPAQPQRMHGRWQSGDSAGAYCSECERYTPFPYRPYTFCPHCGADMREESNERPD